ncbi:MAG: response regulator transcription factor [Lachnospiraceae bacterium]|nr:response regulator transcription factor [Lachnospiraceae bacterium]
MIFHITIIEDNLEEKELLLSAIQVWSEKKHITLQIEHFLDGEQYFLSHSKDESMLYILDIELNTMNGIDVAKKIRSRGYKGNILFLTAFREYVFHGYDVKALHYLLKPVSSEILHKCLDDVYEQFYGNSFIYRDGSNIVQIPFYHILSFSIVKHYVDITTTDNVYACRLSLKNILVHLPKEFIQCHRSYIINLRHIRKIAGTTITLSNKTTVSIGRNYLDDVRHDYADFTMRFNNYTFL